MSHAKPFFRLALSTLLAAALVPISIPAVSQTASAPTPSASASPAVKLDRADRRDLQDLAEGSVAEIAAARVALEKSQNTAIRAYAQKMLDSHGAALDETKKVADAKGVKLPSEPGLIHRTKIATSKALSEKLRDKEYVKQAGIKGHEDMLQHLQKIEKNSQDAEIRALAVKLTPTAQENLQAAKAIVLEP
jgi:putative membrane protein